MRERMCPCWTHIATGTVGRHQGGRFKGVVPTVCGLRGYRHKLPAKRKKLVQRGRRGPSTKEEDDDDDDDDDVELHVLRCRLTY